jgi:hypothetical protein
MAAHPIRVAVLASDGTLLGHVTRRPTNGNWRNLGSLPRIILTNRPAQEFPRTRECNGPEGEWWVKLYEGESPPPNLEAPESVA